ncbi:hypothetical protein KM043_004208 [Ampulex compressa]|nr:hypothetical protein KM043_004208 [Ampulex compressa]
METKRGGVARRRTGSFQERARQEDPRKIVETAFLAARGGGKLIRHQRSDGDVAYLSRDAAAGLWRPEEGASGPNKEIKSPLNLDAHATPILTEVWRVEEENRGLLETR